jgi:hypothetical protein
VIESTSLYGLPEASCNEFLAYSADGVGASDASVFQEIVGKRKPSIIAEPPHAGVPASLTFVLALVVIELVQTQNESQLSRVTQFVERIGVQHPAGQDAESSAVTCAVVPSSRFRPFIHGSRTWFGLGLIS